MITLKQITQRFFQPIPKRIQIVINKWITESEPQEYICKALAYELSDADYRHLYQIGNQKGKYPRLYYLCCIYIHPLTVCQYIVSKH